MTTLPLLTSRHVPCSSSTANLLGAYACLDLCDSAPSPNCGDNSFILFPDKPIKPVDYKKVNGVNTAIIDSFALSSTTQGSKSQTGVAHFGSRRTYNFSPGIDLSKSLLYTPLISNPFGKDSDPDKPRASPDYCIGSSSIKVNGKMVALNKSLLAIDCETGSGGTKISTVVPYTKLQSSIYKTFIMAF